MPELLSVLIIDTDPMRRHALRELLKDHETVRVEAEASDSETGYHLVNQLKPAIVILDLGSPPDPGFAAIERLLIASPQTAIFVSADGQRAETILRAVRAGAQEFLIRPVNKKELHAAIQRVARQRTLVAADPPLRGKLITVFGCKGGRGATTIALNLAVALARASGEPVVAVDLDLQAGDLGLFLNLKPSYTIHDAVTNMDRVDTLFLKNLLCQHRSGVSLLAAPQRIEEADRVQPLRVTQLLTLLKASFPYVVVDTSATYEERIFAALDAADDLLLVVAPDFSSLYHAQRCLELFDRLGYNPAKVKILLNRCPASPAKTVRMAEEVLKRRVFWKFPEDEAVMDSLVAGEPLVSGEKNFPPDDHFMALASQLDGKVGSKGTSPANSKGLRSLFRARSADVSQAQR